MTFSGFSKEVPEMSVRKGLPAVIGLLALTLVSSPAWGGSLKVGGTGAVTALLEQLAPAFKEDSGITLEVIGGLGTSGANAALADGKLGLTFSGRELRDKEKAKGLNVIATLRTPFGLVTSREGPDGLKSKEITTLYGADNPMWPDGTPILITLRPVDESDNIVLGELFPGLTGVLQQLRKRQDLSVAATDQDNLDLAEKFKGSLSSATLTQIMTEKRKLKFVSIDGVAPTLENYQNGSYPYGKSVYVIVPSAISPEARAFLAFLGKPATRSLLENAGMIAGK
jgi:phosphate transport system substrate-binding protein